MKKLEICCYSVNDAVLAQAAGADRIELCSGRCDGGLTPSYGELLQASSLLSIPAHPIIRPRGGDFYYNQSELTTMKNDIALVKELGFSGIVLGVLDNDGSIDITTMRHLLATAGSLSVTFHRAFDVCKDPFEALIQLTDLGVAHILTSGQQPTALQGLPLLKELNSRTTGPIIMAGSGVNPQNLHQFIDANLTEIHASASQQVPSPMQYQNPNINMNNSANQSEYMNYQVNSDAVSAMKKQLSMSI